MKLKKRYIIILLVTIIIITIIIAYFMFKQKNIEINHINNKTYQDSLIFEADAWCSSRYQNYATLTEGLVGISTKQSEINAGYGKYFHIINGGEENYFLVDGCKWAVDSFLVEYEKMIGKSQTIDICNQMRDTDKYWIGLADYTINVTQKGELLGGKCNPKFGDFSENPNIKDFFAWWSEEVLVDNFQKSYSRSEVVLEFANKDNGAHVDSELDKEYYETTRNCGIGLQVSQGEIKYEGKDAMSATVRQIAHEMIFSLAQVEEFKFIKYIVEYIKNY